MYEQDRLNHWVWCRGRHAGLGVMTLIAGLLAACGGGGGGSQPPASTPTPGPTPVPSVAIEAAAGVATSTIVAVAALLGQSTSSPVGGTSDARAELARYPALARALVLAAPAPALQRHPAVVAACAHGGTINGSCTSNASSTTVVATLSNCGLAVPGTSNVLTATGGVSATLQAPGLCGAATPPEVAFTEQLSNLSGTVTDPGGAVIERATVDFSAGVTPTSQGCAGANMTGSITGTLSDAMYASGINVSVRARNFTFALSSSGAPCLQQVTVSGGLDVTDHSEPRQFSETFTGLGLTLVITDGRLLEATIDGALSNDCLGGVELATLTPLQFAPGSECPSQGLLGATRGDGTNGRIEFSADGVGFDFDADGTVDMSVPNCTAAAQCSE